jgi:excisionase family DNA binding protein
VEPLLTKADVADRLRVSPRTVDALRHDGLPSLKVGGSVRFTESALIAYVDDLAARAAGSGAV